MNSSDTSFVPPSWVGPDGQPVPAPPGPAFTPGRRHRPGVLRRIAWVLAVAVVLAGGGLAAVHVWPDRGPWTTAADLADLGLVTVIEDVPLTDPVPIDAQIGDTPLDQAAGLYLDAELTVPAPDGAIEATTTGIQAVPDGDGWGLADHYFVALRVDPVTGAPMEQPQVTAFTVRTAIAAPQATFTIGDDGSGLVEWTEVGGADSYRVLRIEGEDVTDVAQTSDTSWQTTAYGGALLDSDLTARHAEQHSDLRTVQYSDDQLRDEEFIASNPTHTARYAVQALGYGDRSSGVTVLPAALAADLPQGVAVNALAELGVRIGQPLTAEQLPTAVPISTVAGRTVLYPVRYDAEPTSSGGRWAATLTVQGTRFRLALVLDSPDVPTATAAIAAATERAAAVVPAGEYTYQQAAAVDLSQVEIGTVAPDVAYPVHGTTELVRYLSAHLIAGTEYIDVSAYTSDVDDLWDAFYEAVYQTPMALAYARVDAMYLPDQGLMVATYADAAEQRAADQAAVAQAVDTAVAAIITPGMTDEAKVRAINAHLLSVATYDDAAYDAQLGGTASDHPHAWLATGVLLRGTGVCVSYASAFQALADAAGLDSVMVTGTAVEANEGHAWNKVWVNGAWRIVDSTWNDSPWVRSEAFFLQTDAQAAGDRAEDEEWVVDANQGLYAAG